MNTKARLTTRTAAMAACLAALFAGATACGTETATTPAGSNAASSIDQIEGAKASQALYLQRLKAAAEAAQEARGEAASAARLTALAKAEEAQKGTTSQGFGDDRRQAIESQRQYASGYNKALLAER